MAGPRVELSRTRMSTKTGTGQFFTMPAKSRSSAATIHGSQHRHRAQRGDALAQSVTALQNAQLGQATVLVCIASSGCRWCRRIHRETPRGYYQAMLYRARDRVGSAWARRAEKPCGGSSYQDQSPCRRQHLGVPAPTRQRGILDYDCLLLGSPDDVPSIQWWVTRRHDSRRPRAVERQRHAAVRTTVRRAGQTLAR